MPELPEVEAARRAIEEHCVGKRITRAVVADDPKVIDGVTPSLLQSSLSSRTILAALRKGKNLWLRLDSPPFPSFQFGMAGAVYIKGVAVTKYKRSAVSDEEEWPSKFSKVFLELEDGLELSFTDKRRFARVRLLQNPETAPPISELGLDALLELMQVDEFATSLRHKKISIKALLLDQRYISGIGNWIADEVLYQAKIHPLELASNLTKERCESLHKCIKEVIEKAVEVGADSSQFPSNWIFHSREKKPGKAFVNGMKIEFITAGGRTSAFVPELQKLSTKSGKAPAISRKPKTGRDAGKEESHDEPEELEEREEQVSEKASAKKRKVKNGQTTKGAKKAAAKKETQPSSEKPGQDRPKKTVQNVREQTEEIKGEDKEEKEEQKSAKKRNQATKKAAQKKKVRK